MNPQLWDGITQQARRHWSPMGKWPLGSVSSWKLCSKDKLSPWENSAAQTFTIMMGVIFTVFKFFYFLVGLLEFIWKPWPAPLTGLAKGTSGGTEGPCRSSPGSVRSPAQGSPGQVEAER